MSDSDDSDGDFQPRKRVKPNDHDWDKESEKEEPIDDEEDPGDEEEVDSNDDEEDSSAARVKSRSKRQPRRTMTRNPSRKPTRQNNDLTSDEDKEDHEDEVEEITARKRRHPADTENGPRLRARAIRESPAAASPTKRRSTRVVDGKLPKPVPSISGSPTRFTARMSTNSRIPVDDSGPSSSNSSGPATAKGPVICVLCHLSEQDRDDFKARYFRMDSQGSLHAHYLCMFTASNLHQTGDPRVKTNTDEICGFLCTNVQKEKRRAARLKCRYCKKFGAAVGCSVAKCPASYHYPCGLDNGCYFQFMGSFQSYCPVHLPKGTIPRPTSLKSVNTTCVVCLEEPRLSDKMDTLITPCCLRALHRACLSQFAVNAGKHYVKCPSCNVAEGFKAFCDQVGVHVPNADATWLKEEEEERAREDQESGPEVECAAAVDCMCPHGLAFDEDVPGRDWNVERCAAGCGSLLHAACMKHVGRKGKDYRNFCSPCFELELKVSQQLGRPIRSPHKPGAVVEDLRDSSPEIVATNARPVRSRAAARPGRR